MHFYIDKINTFGIVEPTNLMKFFPFSRLKDQRRERIYAFPTRSPRAEYSEAFFVI